MSRIYLDVSIIHRKEHPSSNDEVEIDLSINSYFEDDLFISNVQDFYSLLNEELDQKYLFSFYESPRFDYIDLISLLFLVNVIF